MQRAASVKTSYWNEMHTSDLQSSNAQPVQDRDRATGIEGKIPRLPKRGSNPMRGWQATTST
eukprot:3361274-Amphidinium_carterae.3